ncbi:non-ribosomal peptide synthetase [Actinophytocola xanthii]|uniref:Thioester reductase n=1 Tax=Actinophytocola xanthii TaxID=1912961 RepID=A0A1Q8CK42_9PSEU|nr:non-ribosomal peptide synthetase [Actinophytocola xanthii]OLF14712.1 thioester reductase [Actinophytocola xanthii]
MTASAPTTLVELFERAVAAHPHRPAVSDDHGTLTYRELADQVHALAAVLATTGVGAGDRVALHLPRGAPVVVSVLAILHTGAAYLPIDDVYPAARRDAMLEDGAVSLVLVAPGWRDRIAVPGVAILEWGSWVGADPQTGAPRPPRPRPQDAACVLFTSGTTGTPRGVVLEHRHLLAFASDPTIPVLGPGDRTAQTSSISFDTFTFELWRSVAGGAELVVLPSLPELMGADLGREMRRQRITAMLAPAIALNHVVRHDREAFATLRVLCSGGDVLLPSTCAELLAGGFAGELLNLYGPTEASVAVTGHVVRAVAELGDQVPIGRPFRWARVYVLDRALRPVPDGEPGQLYVSGAGVGRGYLGMPAETASRFVADPFAADGSRMYATGDVVRRGPGGAFEYLGREDKQVKIRGHRVEPREVERFLCRSVAVAEAAVVAVGEQDLRRLVAFVVPADEDFVLRALREFMAGAVPAHLVPAEFVVVEAMPTDAHGKRDWAALLDLLHARTARRRAYQPPRTDTERYLVRAWEDLLAVESVGVGDDFFELGGHSLLAAHLRLLVRADLGATVEPEALFEHSVLAEQASMIDRLRTGDLVR